MKTSLFICNSTRQAMHFTFLALLSRVSPVNHYSCTCYKIIFAKEHNGMGNFIRFS